MIIHNATIDLNKNLKKLELKKHQNQEFFDKDENVISQVSFTRSKYDLLSKILAMFCTYSGNISKI